MYLDKIRLKASRFPFFVLKLFVLKLQSVPISLKFSALSKTAARVIERSSQAFICAHPCTLAKKIKEIGTLGRFGQLSVAVYIYKAVRVPIMLKRDNHMDALPEYH